MTPTEQDKELREKISHRFDSVCAEGHQQSCGEYQTAVDDVMQLITADRKRVELGARLDELEALHKSEIANQSIKKMQIRIGGRIAELKAQQENKDDTK